MSVSTRTLSIVQPPNVGGPQLLHDLLEGLEVSVRLVRPDRIGGLRGRRDRSHLARYLVDHMLNDPQPLRRRKRSEFLENLLGGEGHTRSLGIAPSFRDRTLRH
jgi:hypothetical protein